MDNMFRPFFSYIRRSIIEDSNNLFDPNTCSARLERPSTGSWITVHVHDVLADWSVKNLSWEHWEAFLEPLIRAGWELVSCGDDIN